MSFFDKISKLTKLNDDEDYDDDYDVNEDDYEDDDYYEAPKKSARKTTKKYNEDDDYDEDEKITPITKNRSGKGKFVPVRSKSMEIMVIQPTSVDEDGERISDALVEGLPVVLDFQGLMLDVAQRIIDYTGGACAAISGHLKKVNNFIYIAVPHSVELKGDGMDDDEIETIIKNVSNNKNQT